MRPIVDRGRRWGCSWNGIHCRGVEAAFLVGAVALEGGAATRFGLDDVAVFRGDGVDAEVPDAEVNGFVRDDLHESELAEVEGFSGGDFEPMTAGEEFGGGFDDVLLMLVAAEQTDAEAGDD